VKIKYDDLSLAFDFVSSGAPMEHRAYVSLETGKVHWVSELNPVEEEEIPDDLETSGLYLEIPHKNDLDLGRQLALRFVEERLPDQRSRVADIFHSRGAYRRFKELLAGKGCLEQWYAFEAEATEQALREWCQENDIHLSERDEEQSA
jgi:Uncharacterised protein family (UPF0158)